MRLATKWWNTVDQLLMEQSELCDTYVMHSHSVVLSALPLPFPCQVYDQIQEDPFAGTGDEDTIALTGVENVNFPKMRDWIQEHIKDSAEVIVSHVEDNLLLADVLSVLALLVKYGYYDDSKDVDAVLHPLVDVLNGFKDSLFPASEAPPPS